MPVKFTKDQTAIYTVLRDGSPHTYAELIEAVGGDEHTETQCIKDHVSRMRKKIQPLGYDIICRLISRRGEWQLIQTCGYTHNVNR